MNLKGTLPVLILRTIEREAKHGYRIAQEIKAQSKGVLDFREGTLYPALHGLEQKGLVKSNERVEKGRTRRYYRLTVDGHKALEKEHKEWKSLSMAVDAVLEGAG